jgi:hypothetical protein
MQMKLDIYWQSYAITQNDINTGNVTNQANRKRLSF